MLPIGSSYCLKVTFYEGWVVVVVCTSGRIMRKITLLYRWICLIRVTLIKGNGKNKYINKKQTKKFLPGFFLWVKFLCGFLAYNEHKWNTVRLSYWLGSMTAFHMKSSGFVCFQQLSLRWTAWLSPVYMFTLRPAGGDNTCIRSAVEGHRGRILCVYLYLLNRVNFLLPGTDILCW